MESLDESLGAGEAGVAEDAEVVMGVETEPRRNSRPSLAER